MSADHAFIRDRIERLEAELAVLRASLAPLVNLKTAAGHTGYSQERVRQLAAAGQIIATRDGGRWLVDLASVLAFIARRRSRSA